MEVKKRVENFPNCFFTVPVLTRIVVVVVWGRGGTTEMLLFVLLLFLLSTERNSLNTDAHIFPSTPSSPIKTLSRGFDNNILRNRFSVFRLQRKKKRIAFSQRSNLLQLSAKNALKNCCSDSTRGIRFREASSQEFFFDIFEREIGW